MRTRFYFLFLPVLLFGCSTQQTNVLGWDAFEIVEHKTIQRDVFGKQQSVEWPIFKDATYQLNDSTVVIEGYYYCMESTNLTSFTTETVCILAIAKKPTITVCGTPQYRENEFVIILGNPPIPQGKQVFLKGILHVNRDGATQHLISLESAQRVW